MPEPRTTRATINPELLVWARTTTSGLSPEGAAKKMAVKPGRLTEWGEGRQRPTVSQLRKAANVDKRPLAVFFRPRPPAQPEPLHDFRRFPDREEPALSSDLLLERQRSAARSALHEFLREVGWPL